MYDLTLNILVAFTIGLNLVPSTAFSQDAMASVDPDVQVAIQKKYPEAKLVSLSDVDIKSCYYPPGTVPTTHPGWVKADFNSDGQADHAVLIMELSAEKGSTLRKVSLVVMLSGKSEEWQIMVPHNVPYYHPIATLINKRSPGKLRESAAIGNRVVTPHNSSIEWVFCEKATRVYYWDEKTNRLEQLGTVE